MTSSGGAQYIRWGRTTCPDVEGTELVYSGVAAGSFFSEQSGGTNYLCLIDQPSFLSTVPGEQGPRGQLHGAEYEFLDPSPDGLQSLLNFNVPCAACHNTMRAGKIMIPGTSMCPDSSWTREYFGYLVSERHDGFSTHHRTTFECMDVSPEGIPGSGANTNGALFYFVESTCNGISCPPYEAAAELSCVVCTK